MKININKEIQAIIPKLSDEEYTQLEQNILRDGCLDPLITATVDGVANTLLDGHNRIKICNKHGKAFTTKTLLNGVEEVKIDLDDAKIWVINNQFGRRNITNFTRTELVLKLEEIIELRAKQKQKQGGELKQISAQAPVSTRKELAKIAKVSHNTVDKVKNIKAKIKDEKVLNELRAGTKTINEVHKEIKNEERKEEIKQLKEDIASGKAKLPEGLFEVIVIDPPWRYGEEDEDTFDANGHRAASPYPTMSIDKIIELKIPSTKDCVLWLWTTQKHLRYAFDILDGWGFEDKAILTWVKNKMGTGSWLRSKSEFCIMAIKGKPRINLTNETTVLNANSREHSRKPEEFYTMVDKLCIGRKLDYFARQERKGWSCYGSETNKF